MVTRPQSCHSCRTFCFLKVIITHLIITALVVADFHSCLKSGAYRTSRPFAPLSHNSCSGVWLEVKCSHFGCMCYKTSVLGLVSQQFEGCHVFIYMHSYGTHNVLSQLSFFIIRRVTRLTTATVSTLHFSSWLLVVTCTVCTQLDSFGLQTMNCHFFFSPNSCHIFRSCRCSAAVCSSLPFPCKCKCALF